MSSEASPPEKLPKSSSSEESPANTKMLESVPPNIEKLDGETDRKVSDNSSPEFLSGKCLMTDAETEEHYAAVEASGGFDIPSFPDVSSCEMIILIEFE